MQVYALYYVFYSLSLRLVSQCVLIYYSFSYYPIFCTEKAAGSDNLKGDIYIFLKKYLY